MLPSHIVKRLTELHTKNTDRWLNWKSQEGAEYEFMLLTTWECNQRCKYCNVLDLLEVKGSNIAPSTYYAWFTNFVDTVLTKDKLKLKIHLHGGEPTLRVDLFEQFVLPLYKYMKERGMEKRLEYSIVTNGSGISDRVWEIIKSLAQNMSLCFSLDGLKDDHDRLNYPGAFEKIEAKFRESLLVFPTVSVHSIITYDSDYEAFCQYLIEKASYVPATKVVGMLVPYTYVDSDRIFRGYEIPKVVHYSESRLKPEDEMYSHAMKLHIDTLELPDNLILASDGYFSSCLMTPTPTVRPDGSFDFCFCYSRPEFSNFFSKTWEEIEETWVKACSDSKCSTCEMIETCECTGCFKDCFRCGMLWKD